MPSILLFLISCGEPLEIEGFEKDRWKDSIINCDEYRSTHVKLIIDQKEKLLLKSQRVVNKLLGHPPKQKLYSRNQKLVYYPLDCNNERDLSIRIDALGRVQEIQVIKISKDQ